MKLDALHRLPSASLRALSASLRSGALSVGLSRFAVQQAAGAAAAEVEAELRGLETASMSRAQIAIVLEAIADARETRPEASSLFDLVLSGPELQGTPTADTGAVVRALIAGAQREVLLVTYAIHDGATLFEPLAARMAAVPELKVTFVVHIGRSQGDTSLDGEIVRRFATEFKARHWPWAAQPAIFYDPRGLSTAMDQRSSMHAKCIAVDRRRGLITSANFTEAAQRRNIEAGVLLRHEPTVERLVSYFDGLRRSEQLVRCWLPEQ